MEAIDINLSNLLQSVNPVYHAALWNPLRYGVYVGGSGSGKSHFMGQDQLLKSFQRPRRRALIVRKVARTNRISTWQLLQDHLRDWNATHLVRINKSDMQIEFQNKSIIWFTGLDDLEKIKSIQKLDEVWIEEASEISEDEFDELDRRLRGMGGNFQINISLNPVTRAKWIKKRFFDAPVYWRDPHDPRCMAVRTFRNTDKADAWVQGTTYQDNCWLDGGYEDVVKRQDEGSYAYQVYALGLWAALGDLVYNMPTILPDANWPKRFDDVCYGLDFGFVNPSVLFETGRKDRAIYEREIIYQRNLTNHELIEWMRRDLPDYKGEIIFADSAEPDRIEEISQAGFNVIPIKKGPGSILAGISYCSGEEIFLHEESRHTIKEYESYCWKKDKEGNEIDVPVKLMDHAMDAKRYAEFGYHSEYEVGSAYAGALGDLTPVY